jgi:hypothetical protein
MIFCPNCGEEIDRSTRFCPKCGEELSIDDYVESNKKRSSYSSTDQDSPPSSKNKSSLSKTQVLEKIKSILIITLLIGASSVIGLLAFTHRVDIRESRTYKYIPDEVNSYLDFDLDVVSAQVVYLYNETPVNEAIHIKANFDFQIRVPHSKSSLDDIYQITWEKDSSPSFTIKKSRLLSFSFWDNTKIYVTLRTDLEYDLDVHTGSGSIDVNLPVHTDLKALNVETGSGRIFVEPMAHNDISDGISLKTGSGSIIFTTTGLFVNDSLLLHTDSGSIQVDLESSRVGGDLQLTTGSGDITVYGYTSIFEGKISTDSGSGSQTYIFYDVTLCDDFSAIFQSGEFLMDTHDLNITDDLIFTGDGGSGSIQWDMKQNFSLGHFITGDFSTESGRIIFNIDAKPVYLPIRFDYRTDSGAFYFQSDNQTAFISGNEFIESENFETATNGLDFLLITESGDIIVSY